MSDDFLENLSKQAVVTSYLPRYSNKAINFTGDDMGGDKAMFILFDYIVIAILAFVFAITTSNTIVKEAGVIGTLRASGYTRGEIVRHYMINPILVTFISAVIGNIIGYTVMVKFIWRQCIITVTVCRLTIHYGMQKHLWIRRLFRLYLCLS